VAQLFTLGGKRASMPIPKHQLIRLIGAAVCSFVALGFVVIQTGTETPFFSHVSDSFPVHPHFSALVMLFIDYGRWTLIFPLVCLVFGSWLLYKSPQSLVVFELLISLIWLFTIIVVGLCFIGWQGQYLELEWRELLYIKNRG
jgi:hypothetical protein